MQDVGVNDHSSKDAKIALFRSLFRGREDVYAIRKCFKSGEVGLYPERNPGLESGPFRRCVPPEEGRPETRKLLPLTDEVLRQHFEGKQNIGIYPLLLDETCWSLAVDFDKKSWREDATAFLETCREPGVSAALERSRSGNGGHVWIFFERAMPAGTARKPGSLILTRRMDGRHQLGMDSYDRFFPNQDTMSRGGFENLIALLLQWTPRQNENSVFIDSDFRSYADQWTFLSGMEKMARDFVEALVREALRTGSVMGVRISLADEPWNLPPSSRRTVKAVEGPFPERVGVVRPNLVYGVFTLIKQKGSKMFAGWKSQTSSMPASKKACRCSAAM